MRCQVVFANSARNDLVAIRDFIARENPDAAERMVNRIIERTEVLAEFPKVGKRVEGIRDESLREILESPYRLIYRIKEKERRVEIVRVWHASRGNPVFE